MRSTFAPLALAALVAANPVPQGVTSEIRPQSSPPAGCSENYSGTFAIQIVNVTTSTKRSLTKRADTLMVTLADGVLKDDKDRTGYIAANNQFQFDSPPQTGAIYTAGFSVCGNGSLALGDDAIWYACASGGFFNLYDQNSADQCSMVYIETVSTGSSGSGQQSDGQPTGTVATSAAVSQISDAQPQAPTAVTSAVSQISDGQVQATSAMTAAPVSQISDGQVQATTAAASQISDGQVQATPVSTAMAASQISDGQVQATPISPVSQISDGQVQATGAIPYPGGNSTMAPIPSASVQPQIGGASALSTSTAFALVAGLLAIALL